MPGDVSLALYRGFGSDNPNRNVIYAAGVLRPPCLSWNYGLMEKIPMTRAGFVALEAELKNLKSVERPAIIQAIAEARELGDLSENAEYHSAREKQSFIEGRIKELEGIIGLAEVIDPTTMSGTIKFGATVTLVDEDTDEEKTWQIVGEHEANIERGLLNIKSPIARALIGKDEGDSVEVRTPGGEKSYEVLKIQFI
jgi:transcription elongation factor GreA